MKEEIRKAEEKDVSRLLELFNSDPNFVGGDFAYQERHILEFITNPVNQTFVYETENIIVGVIQTQFWKGSKYVLLNDIVVDKDYQKNGIGFKLQEHIEKLAKDEGYEFIYLFSEENNTKAHELVKKGGYKEGKKFTFFSKEI